MLLEMRYLCYQSWAQISVTLGHDERWMRRLHVRALNQIATNVGLLPFAR